MCWWWWYSLSKPVTSLSGRSTLRARRAGWSKLGSTKAKNLRGGEGGSERPSGVRGWRAESCMAHREVRHMSERGTVRGNMHQRKMTTQPPSLPVQAWCLPVPSLPLCAGCVAPSGRHGYSWPRGCTMQAPAALAASSALKVAAGDDGGRLEQLPKIAAD